MFRRNPISRSGRRFPIKAIAQIGEDDRKMLYLWFLKEPIRPVGLKYVASRHRLLRYRNGSSEEHVYEFTPFVGVSVLINAVTKQVFLRKSDHELIELQRNVSGLITLPEGV